MIVSHSEVESRLLCERRHYYAFGERIQKNEVSESLQRGISGHSMLHMFFQRYALTSNWNVSLDAMDTEVAKLIAQESDGTQATKLLNVLTLTRAGLEFWRKKIERWNIQGVENEFRLKIGDHEFCFTVDLLIFEDGFFKVIDWKFAQDFYDNVAIALLPQIPKYIGGLRALGYNVDGGYYGFLRTRSLKSNDPRDLFKLVPVQPSRRRIKRTFEEFLDNAQEIVGLKNAGLEEWEASTHRVGNNLVCRSCSYKFPCSVELDGNDASKIKKEMFHPSTYGYKEKLGD